MPDLAVEYLPLTALAPYARNARTHSPAQVAQLVASIREFGWTNPVLIDEAGSIIAGHGRVMAAQQMGMDQVPCIRLTHLTDTQRRAYVLADNRLALNAGWDEELLAQELAALDEMSFDLGLVGFDAAYIEEMLGAAETVAMPSLPSGDREPFQQVTFTLHDSQAAALARAIKAAKDIGPFIAPVSANSNGNALARICDIFMARHADR